MYFIAAGMVILQYCPVLNARGTLIQNIKIIIRKVVGTNNQKAKFSMLSSVFIKITQSTMENGIYKCKNYSEHF
jgi:hypothetical protein